MRREHGADRNRQPRAQGRLYQAVHHRFELICGKGQACQRIFVRLGTPVQQTACSDGPIAFYADDDVAGIACRAAVSSDEKAPSRVQDCADAGRNTIKYLTDDGLEERFPSPAIFPKY